MRYLLFSFLFIIVLHLTANEKAIIEISIPKCGSNLLRRCLELLTGKQMYFEFKILEPDTVAYYEDRYFFVHHLKYTKENKKNLDLYGDSIKFFIFRDPRDQLISNVFWGKQCKPNLNSPEPKRSLQEIYALEDLITLEKYGFFPGHYKGLNFDEHVLQLIYGGTAYYDGMGPYLPEYKTKGIADFYYSYLGWLQCDDICIIRFEDLIGSKGGGDDIVQLHTIKRIAEHLGKNLTESEIKAVSNSLFGHYHTFRKGQIGAWKKHLKPFYKRCFKEVAGQLLIELGYETGFDW